MELAAPFISPGGLILHVNKVHSVKTIDRVAKELGESVDWLHDVADEMDTEDGVIWVYGGTDDGVMAFTDFGIETLTDLIEMHKQDPTILSEQSEIDLLRPTPKGYAAPDAKNLRRRLVHMQMRSSSPTPVRLSRVDTGHRGVFPPVN
jgi:hypothetical protein